MLDIIVLMVPFVNLSQMHRENCSICGVEAAVNEVLFKAAADKSALVHVLEAIQSTSKLSDPKEVLWLFSFAKTFTAQSTE